MKIKHIMSNREEKVMEHLWEKGAPMTITELEELMAEDGLSKASIFKAVQALIKCSYVKVSGVELVGKTYARQLEAEVSKEEYAAFILLEKGFTRSSLGEIAVAMTGSDRGSKANVSENEKLIRDLEEIIAKLRQ
jgi:hypothetical protein